MEQSSPSALLLTGGNDLALMSDDPLSHERDVGERDLLRIARDKHLPVIGICRGMQFLVAEAGGSLVRVHEHVGQGHPIVAAENLPASFRRRDLNRESVKSFHNFGVSELPAGMHALARSPDGFVEACLDLENRRLGIMWHPERQSPADPKDLSLLQRFLDIPL